MNTLSKELINLEVLKILMINTGILMFSKGIDLIHLLTKTSLPNKWMFERYHTTYELMTNCMSISNSLVIWI